MRRLLAGVNWKAFGVLLGAGLLGVVAILPYMMELVESSIFGQAAAPRLAKTGRHLASTPPSSPRDVRRKRARVRAFR